MEKTVSSEKQNVFYHAFIIIKQRNHNEKELMKNHFSFDLKAILLIIPHPQHPAKSDYFFSSIC